MIHSGIGETALRKLMTAIKVPAAAASTLKAREREIGLRFEEVAKESCKVALQNEVDTSTDIVISVDAGWQCADSRRNYNSKSGHSTLIGVETGKIVNYATRIRNCKQCEKNPAKAHDCRLNWGGSAKSMEPDMAVSMVKELTASGHRLKAIIGDDDAATMAQLKDEIPYQIIKFSDINHARKNVSAYLYKLGTKHSILTSKVIKYICYCFSIAIITNKNDPKTIEMAISNIVPHMYNEHVFCKDWCTHKNSLEKRYTRLPHGKPLTNQVLRVEWS